MSTSIRSNIAGDITTGRASGKGKSNMTPYVQKNPYAKPEPLPLPQNRKGAVVPADVAKRVRSGTNGPSPVNLPLGVASTNLIIDKTVQRQEDTMRKTGESYRLSLLTKMYKKAKRKAAELNAASTQLATTAAERGSSAIAIKVHGQQAAKVYTAMSTLLYASIGLTRTEALEKFILKKGSALPGAIFDITKWKVAMDAARDLRVASGQRESSKSNMPDAALWDTWGGDQPATQGYSNNNAWMAATGGPMDANKDMTGELGGDYGDELFENQLHDNTRDNWDATALGGTLEGGDGNSLPGSPEAASEIYADTGNNGWINSPVKPKAMQSSLNNQTPTNAGSKNQVFNAGGGGSNNNNNFTGYLEEIQRLDTMLQVKDNFIFGVANESAEIKNEYVAFTESVRSDLLAMRGVIRSVQQTLVPFLKTKDEANAKLVKEVADLKDELRAHAKAAELTKKVGGMMTSGAAAASGMLSPLMKESINSNNAVSNADTARIEKHAELLSEMGDLRARCAHLDAMVATSKDDAASMKKHVEHIEGKLHMSTQERYAIEHQLEEAQKLMSSAKKQADEAMKSMNLLASGSSGVEQDDRVEHLVKQIDLHKEEIDLHKAEKADAHRQLEESNAHKITLEEKIATFHAQHMSRAHTEGFIAESVTRVLSRPGTPSKATSQHQRELIEVTKDADLKVKFLSEQLKQAKEAWSDSQIQLSDSLEAMGELHVKHSETHEKHNAAVSDLKGKHQSELEALQAENKDMMETLDAMEKQMHSMQQIASVASSPPSNSSVSAIRTERPKSPVAPFVDSFIAGAVSKVSPIKSKQPQSPGSRDREVSHFHHKEISTAGGSALPLYETIDSLVTDPVLGTYAIMVKNDMKEEKVLKKLNKSKQAKEVQKCRFLLALSIYRKDKAGIDADDLMKGDLLFSDNKFKSDAALNKEELLNQEIERLKDTIAEKELKIQAEVSKVDQNAIKLENITLMGEITHSQDQESLRSMTAELEKLQKRIISQDNEVERLNVELSRQENINENEHIHEVELEKKVHALQEEVKQLERKKKAATMILTAQSSSHGTGHGHIGQMSQNNMLGEETLERKELQMRINDLEERLEADYEMSEKRDEDIAKYIENETKFKSSLRVQTEKNRLLQQTITKLELEASRSDSTNDHDDHSDDENVQASAPMAFGKAAKGLHRSMKKISLGAVVALDHEVHHHASVADVVAHTKYVEAVKNLKLLKAENENLKEQHLHNGLQRAKTEEELIKIKKENEKYAAAIALNNEEYVKNIDEINRKQRSVSMITKAYAPETVEHGHEGAQLRTNSSKQRSMNVSTSVLENVLRETFYEAHSSAVKHHMVARDKHEHVEKFQRQTMEVSRMRDQLEAAHRKHAEHALVVESHAKTVEAHAKAVESAHAVKLHVGSSVEANYGNSGTWFRGKITSVTGNGDERLFAVDYADGDHENDIPLTNIRGIVTIVREAAAAPILPDHIVSLNAELAEAKKKIELLEFSAQAKANDMEALKQELISEATTLDRKFKTMEKELTRAKQAAIDAEAKAEEAEAAAALAEEANSTISLKPILSRASTYDPDGSYVSDAGHGGTSTPHTNNSDSKAEKTQWDIKFATMDFNHRAAVSALKADIAEYKAEFKVYEENDLEQTNVIRQKEEVIDAQQEVIAVLKEESNNKSEKIAVQVKAMSTLQSKFTALQSSAASDHARLVNLESQGDGENSKEVDISDHIQVEGANPTTSPLLQQRTAPTIEGSPVIANALWRPRLPGEAQFVPSELAQPTPYQIKAVIHIQRMARGFLGKVLANHVILERSAQIHGILVAYRPSGTTQGEAGWYVANNELFYFGLHQGDFVLLAGPISAEEYDTALLELQENGVEAIYAGDTIVDRLGVHATRKQITVLRQLLKNAEHEVGPHGSLQKYISSLKADIKDLKVRLGSGEEEIKEVKKNLSGLQETHAVTSASLEERVSFAKKLREELVLAKQQMDMTEIRQVNGLGVAGVIGDSEGDNGADSPRSTFNTPRGSVVARRMAKGAVPPKSITLAIRKVLRSASNFTSNNFRGIIAIQALVRRFLIKCKIRHRKMVELASQKNLLVAIPGTIQGQNGWYMGPKGMLYYFVMQGDEWLMVAGPLAEKDYNTIMDTSVRVVHSHLSAVEPSAAGSRPQSGRPDSSKRSGRSTILSKMPNSGGGMGGNVANVPTKKPIPYPTKGPALLKCKFELNVERHGITGETFIDKKTKKLYLAVSVDHMVANSTKLDAHHKLKE